MCFFDYNFTKLINDFYCNKLICIGIYTNKYFSK